MKKLFLFAMALCILLIGCNKEGEYNPAEKIKRISIQEQGEAKQLRQEWTWDSNLLKKIEYFYSYGTPLYDERYTYEKNLLTRVDESNGYYWRVFYKDNLYDKVEYYDPKGTVLLSAKFTYANKKVSKVEVTEYFEGDWKSNISNGGFISKLFPQELIQGINKISSKSKSKAYASVYNISYTYDKDNIKEYTLEQTELDYSLKITCQFEKYDTKLNPLYRFYAKSGMIDFVGYKNNPLEVILTYSEIYDGEVETARITATYDYTYEGKYPTEVVTTERDGDGGVWRFTTFYEYQ